MKLYTGGYLTFYMPQKKHFIEIPLNTPTPLKEILSDLQIPIEEIHLVALNGEQADVETAIIGDSDIARIYSSVDGG
ncbi:MAG: hypothetical protein MUO77_15600 [Anaerolineales bacterium]|nr:hypothetical protein [Anaerolineales bacterium]